MRFKILFLGHTGHRSGAQEARVPGGYHMGHTDTEHHITGPFVTAGSSIGQHRPGHIGVDSYVNIHKHMHRFLLSQT